MITLDNLKKNMRAKMEETGKEKKWIRSVFWTFIRFKQKNHHIRGRYYLQLYICNTSSETSDNNLNITSEKTVFQ